MRRIDRLTHRYADAVAFAKVLLRSGGTQIAHGQAHGWCFLIRTPELVEAGIRAVLQRTLGGRWRIEKNGIALEGAKLTLNPDLVFDQGLAVGDVKYKLLDPEWNRADLYQSVAFAAGYECDCAAVVGFSDGRSPAPPPVRVGKIGVEAFGWDVSSPSGQAAGDTLAAEIAAFLTRATRRRADLSAA